MTEQLQYAGPLVQLENLAVTFYTPQGTVRAVRDASLEVHRGEVLGLVGESGCGKSTVAFAMMGYLPGTAEVEGAIRFEARDMAHVSASELRALRGDRVAMVYQDPATSLNPTMRVGPQIEEVLREHRNLNPRQARERTAELFESVGMADPGRIGRYYPHHLSGGMQQRVVIAMALACDPDLLIMDEPTTGLDVTTEATILDLVVDLKDRVNAGILYVTHNLGVIARIADRVAVMYSGQTVEHAPVGELFKNPRHPYTAGLLSCVPLPPTEENVVTRLSQIPGSVFPASERTVEECLFASRCAITRESCRETAPTMVDAGDSHKSRCSFWPDVVDGIWGDMAPRDQEGRNEHSRVVLDTKSLWRFYEEQRKKYLLFGPPARPPVRAVVDVDFQVGSGRTLGIVGESGSGKTTVARTIVGLIPPTRGEILLSDDSLAGHVEKRTREQRASLRMVFQNPSSSLNPKLKVSHVMLRPLRKFARMGRRESRERAAELLKAVGLDPVYLDRSPRELSGGEQQRVALAGAFAGNSDLIVADEAVSALDVSVQAQVLNLLEEHQREVGTAYVFISHDLGVVRYVSDDILVMYAGHVAESGPAENVLKAPYHPYTEALLSAAPLPDPDATPTPIRLSGAVPTLREEFTGCFFAGRCPRRIGSICDDTLPPAQTSADSTDHVIHCHIPLDGLAAVQLVPGKALVPSQVL